MKYIKYTLIIALGVFSFYFSDRVILYIESLSPIMQTIKEQSQGLSVDAIDAKIEGNTIIPGKKGRTVNERESYLKMNDFGTFNETFFVYNEIKPNISLEDNLDKIIIQGQDKTSISLITDNIELEEYLNKESIPYAKIITNKNEIEDRDTIYINGNNDITSFRELNIYLKRKKKNSKICIVNDYNVNICKTSKNYLVKPTLEIYKSNLASSKSKISGGMIIYIHNNLSLNEAKIIINEIKYHNLKIKKITELIKE